MAEAITDEHVSAVLRVFVRRCEPMVQRLQEDGEPVEVEDDPEIDRNVLDKLKSAVANIKRPGMRGWALLPVDERVDWWVSRVGRFTSLLASFTGLAGALGDRLPLQDMLGSASQGLLLCAIASERGVDDIGTKVRLLGAVLFERAIDPDVARGKGDAAADEQTVEDLAPGDDLPAEEPAKGRKYSIKAGAKWLWRQARILFSITGELEKRPQGRFYHKILGMLPVVGMAGDYLGERSALKRVAKAGTKWLAQEGIQ
ncbi:hypothetical protein JOF56_001168 [Kibdelosporangium banguiense]|uniref:Uncharacterized protein n=1 Tax=Kibdelosporangium banguiense TaxID=1365924 RepID=A0ABS4TA78_9PSEU|nr:hypothetical protein [Kibdelosporangium banguiense]MBP2320783.1 hypothetical protein [Kibdelosporangium banguiense]